VKLSGLLVAPPIELDESDWRLGGPRQWRRLLVGFAGLIVVAEILAARVDLSVGLAVHGAVLILVSNLLMRARSTDEFDVLLALALVPVVRLVSATALPSETSPLGALAATTATTAMALVLVLRFLRRGPGRLGFRRLTRAEVFLAFDVAVVTLLARGLLRSDLLAGLQATSDEFGGHIARAVIVLTLAAVVEETLYRGLLQPALCRTFGDTGVWLTTAVWLAATASSMPILLVLVFAAAGVSFGWIVRRTDSIGGVVVAHVVISLGLLVVGH
jgi:membrane protease YdiL (CAAX protease family)